MIETVDLVLTGGRTGRTVKINGKQFVDGVIRLRGSREQLEPVISYYGRAYAAFPAGSAALKAHQARDAENGKSQTDATSQPGKANGLVSANSDANSGRTQSAGAADHDGRDHAAKGGSAGVRSDRDGHADAGLRAGQESIERKPDASGELKKIREAVLSLDPSVDEQWTTDGKPAVEAVAQAANDAAVSRKQIDAAAGDLNREQVAAKLKVATEK